MHRIFLETHRAGSVRHAIGRRFARLDARRSGAAKLAVLQNRG